MKSFRTALSPSKAAPGERPQTPFSDPPRYNPMSQNNGRVYEFGPFRLHATRRALLRDGRPVPLTSKAFDTLLVLVERSGEVLPKGEMMDALWPDTAVEENNLTQHVSMLRKALGERAGAHRYVVTVPGRGYSFVAEVREVAGDAGAF